MRIRCRFRIDRLDTAPPPPERSFFSVPAEEGGDRYFLIRSSFVRQTGSIGPLDMTETFLRRRRFFEDPRRALRSILGRIMPGFREPPPDLVDALVEFSAATLAPGLAGNARYAAAPVVPVSLSVAIERGDADASPVANDDRRRVEAVSELSLAEAAAAAPSTVPADRSAVEELEEAAERGEYYQSHDQCSVCLEEFGGTVDDVEDEKIVRMACRHVCHKKCIVEWLMRNHLCPLCRYAMPQSSTT